MIFFDIDNTLINHTMAAEMAVFFIYDKYGKQITDNRNEFVQKWEKISKVTFDLFIHNKITFKERLVYIISELFKTIENENEIEEIISCYLQKYEENWCLYPDVQQCLELLKGYKMGIITNGSCDQQMRKLKKCGILTYFRQIIISEEYHTAKPNLEIFKIACKTARCDAKQCIYIGNSLEHDILPFVKLGGYGVWVNRKKKTCSVSSYICSVQSLDDVPYIVKNRMDNNEDLL